MSIPQPFPCYPQGSNAGATSRQVILITPMSTDTELPFVSITTDGGCEPNPGNGGWACVLRCRSVVKELSGWERETTNNRMEWVAIIKGLEALTKRCRLTIRTDSMICVYALQGRGKKLHKRGNLDLVMRAVELFQQHEATVEWVKGHNGDPDNERCDELAGAAIRSIPRPSALDFPRVSSCRTT